MHFLEGVALPSARGVVEDFEGYKLHVPLWLIYGLFNHYDLKYIISFHLLFTHITRWFLRKFETLVLLFTAIHRVNNLFTFTGNSFKWQLFIYCIIFGTVVVLQM